MGRPNQGCGLRQNNMARTFASNWNFKEERHPTIQDGSKVIFNCKERREYSLPMPIVADVKLGFGFHKNMLRSVKPTMGINVALATTYMPLEPYASKVNSSRSSRTVTHDFNSRTSASYEAL